MSEPEGVSRSRLIAQGFIRLTRETWSNLSAWRELRGTPYGVVPALLIGLTGLVETFDSQAFALAGPEFVRHRGILIAQIISIQQYIGFFTVFVAVGVGWWADRHSRVPLFGVGTAVAGIGACLTGAGQSAFSIGSWRVLDSTANTTADVPSFSLLADYYPPEARGRVFAFLGTMSRVGSVAALPVGAVAISGLGLTWSFVAFGAPIVIIGLVSLVGLREPVRGYFERARAGADEDVARTEDEPQSFGEAWRATFAVRTVRRLFVSSIASGAGSAMLVLFPFFLEERYGLGVVGRALVAAPQVLAALVGGVYGGGLVDRVIRRNPGRVMSVYAAFIVLLALTVLVYAFEPPLPVVVAAGCLAGFGGALIGPALLSVYSQVVPPGIRTQGLQMTNLSEAAVYLVFFPLATTIFGHYGYSAVFFTAVPCFLLAALLTASAGSFFAGDRRNAVSASTGAEEYRRAVADGTAKILVCRDVCVDYDGVRVLFGVDFDVTEGEIVALLGTNGAGKSTLLRAISGLREASDGAILFAGRDVTHMPPHEIAARGLVHMPGGRGVFPGLSVDDNLRLALWGAGQQPVDEALAEVREIFPILGQRASAPAALLSGGEQQMLALAQAFLMRPTLLVIDELSLGLAPGIVAQLLDVVREINRRGVTVVIVEQSVSVALQLAERAIFLEKGEVRFVGQTADLLARPDILRAVYVKGTGAVTDRVPARARTALPGIGTLPALEVHDVRKAFGGVAALDGVSLQLPEGGVLGIIGPNGSGKTTLFDVVSGFLTADSGTVLLQGRELTGLGPEERSRLGLVRRFQDARLFPSLTVFETLLVALEKRLEVRGTLPTALRSPGARRAERRIRQRADELIALLNLGAYRDKYVRELSTGLRRVTDLACVLAAEPAVLLLDEPSSGIAQTEAEGLAPLLRRVRHDTGCSILIIEHDMSLITAVSDELLALASGRVIAQGSASEVLADPQVVASYLGGSEESMAGALP